MSASMSIIVIVQFPNRLQQPKSLLVVSTMSTLDSVNVNDEAIKAIGTSPAYEYANGIEGVAVESFGCASEALSSARWCSRIQRTRAAEG